MSTTQSIAEHFDLELPRDIACAPPWRQELYAQIVAKGESPMMAEMLALQKAPGGVSDIGFMEGHGTLADQFKGDERGLEIVLKRCARKGFKPNMHDVYVPAFGNSKHIEHAFISRDNARGQVRRAAEINGLAVEGTINVKGRQPEVDPLENAPRLAPKIARRLVKEKLAKDPDLLRKSTVREQMEEVTHKHGRQD